MDYVKFKPISVRDHPTLNEKWVQDRIAEDPAILGLGDAILKDKERHQPHAGRLDLLLQDSESSRRYEVEVQLGRTDESHIIRTIEYWDIERKRYPQYDHTAVIVAEDITSRFLNVISLFNGVIPLVAIQMQAIEIGDKVSLIFTTVLSQVELGLVDEDDDVPADRSYWETRATPQTVRLADDLLKLVRQVDPDVELKYNKSYIGLARDGQPNNFVTFKPQKKGVRMNFQHKRSEELEKRLDEAGLDMLDYDAKWRRYKVRLKESDLKKHEELLVEIIRAAKDEYGS